MIILYKIIIPVKSIYVNRNNITFLLQFDKNMIFNCERFVNFYILFIDFDIFIDINEKNQYYGYTLIKKDLKNL